MEFFLMDDEDCERDSHLRRRIRDSANPLEMETNLFLNNYRVSKEAFVYLLEVISPKLKSTSYQSAIPNILKLATALRFCAQGSYQLSVGNEYKVGLAQSTISVVLDEVLMALESSIYTNWIKFQSSETEIQETKIKFYEKSGFPGVIGCIDGTHVKITSPRREIQYLYYNRKGYYSINVMIVCDHKMKIKYINARFPGATHDSMVFQLSHLKNILENMRTTNHQFWLLGDAGYALKPYLMTPYRSAVSGSEQSNYNKKHAQARCIVERTIGVLKSRFRCLLSARSLHYAPEKCTRIINVCAALHNICVHYNVQQPEEVADEVEDNTVVEDTGGIQHLGEEIRDRICRTLTQ